MKKLIFVALCTIALTGYSQLKSSLQFAGGMFIKSETEINITDSSFVLKDVKSGKESKYRIVSKGTNDNYKISDGVRDVIIQFTELNQKMKGTFYKREMLFQVSAALYIAYYLKE